MLATQKLTGEAPWLLFYNFTHGRFASGDIAGSSNRQKVTEMLALRVSRDVIDSKGDIKQVHQAPVCTLATKVQIDHYEDRMRGPTKQKLVPVRFSTDTPPFQAGQLAWLPGNQALAFCEGMKRNGIRQPPCAEAVNPDTLLTQRETDALAEAEAAEKASKKDPPKPRRRRRTTVKESPDQAVIDAETK